VPVAVAVAVITAVESQLDHIKTVWDQMYPENRVGAQEGR
jgi:hypothetical protein